MPTWKLTIEYDGTRYHGWQSQKNTDRTVQGVLLRAARELLGEDASAGGAGRTDAGVHALAQVAHLKARKKMPEIEIARGLNDRLPFDVNVIGGRAGGSDLSRAPRRRVADVSLSLLAPPNGLRQTPRLVDPGSSERRRDAARREALRGAA